MKPNPTAGTVEAHEGHTGQGPFCLSYEGKFFHSKESELTVLAIKELVGQEPDVPLAQVVDGKQIERPNDYVVDLSRGCSFKRVPVFVRG